MQGIIPSQELIQPRQESGIGLVLGLWHEFLNRYSPPLWVWVSLVCSIFWDILQLSENHMYDNTEVACAKHKISSLSWPRCQDLFQCIVMDAHISKKWKILFCQTIYLFESLSSSFVKMPFTTPVTYGQSQSRPFGACPAMKDQLLPMTSIHILQRVQIHPMNFLRRYVTRGSLSTRSAFHWWVRDAQWLRQWVLTTVS
jgi:hypothetical protein